MLRTWVRGRRGAAVGAASVAVVCLGAGAAVGFGGGDGRDPYVAVGAAGGSPGESGAGVAPTGKVRLVPLDSAPPKSSESSKSPGSAKSPKAPKSHGASKDSESPGRAPGASASASSRKGGGAAVEGTRGGLGAGNPGGAPGSSAPGSPAGGGGATAPAGPAALKVGTPELKGTDKRWCQDVTLALRNSGGSAVRSGTVTFGTHIIGGLGIDWATIESTEKLPVPIAAGAETKKTWTVCVDSWRVPLGMHLETRDVSVDWK
ncbi:hypothetical protein G3I40_01065 [Streptomyces sp. SID14478]|nr:hypothetical protein [Streptomyces sp. SID14478]NEB73839.1 hypothetical protein [Streptomyces sp. SID14478]